MPLEQLAAIELVRSPNELWRENQQPVITVSAELGGSDLGSVNRELEARLGELHFPPGYRWELAGEHRAEQESFRSLLGVMLLAAALVFLLLGFQFHSLTLPLLIFLAQPVSLASAMFALWITGTPLNVSSFMGAILLIGLDVKNGIILIEYIGQLRAAGTPLADALVRAGRARFRPILMTSLTTIFGLVPLALGLGPGADAAAAGRGRDRRPGGQHAAHPAADSGGLSALVGSGGPEHVVGRRRSDIVGGDATRLKLPGLASVGIAAAVSRKCECGSFDDFLPVTTTRA